MLVEGGFCESASLDGFEYLKGEGFCFFCLCVAESRVDSTDLRVRFCGIVKSLVV